MCNICDIQTVSKISKASFFLPYLHCLSFLEKKKKEAQLHKFLLKSSLSFNYTILKCTIILPLYMIFLPNQESLKPYLQIRKPLYIQVAISGLW